MVPKKEKVELEHILKSSEVCINIYFLLFFFFFFFFFFLFIYLKK